MPHTDSALAAIVQLLHGLCRSNLAGSEFQEGRCCTRDSLILGVDVPSTAWPGKLMLESIAGTRYR
ncbi:hypothetical protein GCM10027343_18610 [Noviherbaspirillum agri]